MKKQLSWVKQQLRLNGQVSRNEALRNYISRLGAIICDLKSDGWDIDGGYDSKKDFVYKLKKAPYIPKCIYDPVRDCMVLQKEPPKQDKLI